MNGFTDLKTAAAEELPDATAVLDSFHVMGSPATSWTAAANDSDSHRGRATAPSTAPRAAL